jgi:hypothetical protein
MEFLVRLPSAILFSLAVVVLVVTATHAGHSQAVTATAGHAVAQASAPDLNNVVERMEQAQLHNRSRYRPYTMTREYRLYGGDQAKPSSEVLASVSFVPPSTKRFTIDKVAGSDRGEKVVRRILDKETEMSEQDAPGAITRQNYEFSYIGHITIDGHSCHVLRLNPKREEKDLVDGKAYVDAHTYLVRRVEGYMAKTPSWWLKKIYLTLDFSDVRGMWLQTATHAEADVRMLGRHTLTSEAVNIRTGDEVAQDTGVPTPATQRTPRKPRHGSASTLIGAGILEP